MKNIYLALWALISLSLFSCETLVNDVDPDRLPRSDNKLVVHGYLSPQDTIININVFLSSQLIGGSMYFGESSISIYDAIVTLTNQGKSVTLLFDSQTFTYRIKATAMPILEGQTYELKVERGGQTAEAQCTVPKAVAIQEIKQDSVDTKGIFSSDPKFIPPKDYLYRIVWQDSSSHKNYYRVGGYVFLSQQLENSFPNYGVIPIILPIRFEENNRNQEFFSDERSNGMVMVSGVGRSSSSVGYFPPNSTVKARRVELILLNCEKTYYDYHRAVQSFDDDNPFAEPSLIPSNIKNGLGCFAAYNRSVVVLK